MENRESGHNNNYLFFIIIVCLVSSFWIWRIHYGAADAYRCPDESFYLSIPYRMLFGDRLIFDEMNTTQLVAFILYPIVKIWHSVSNNNTEGIILLFRYIWLFYHLGVSAVIYFLVKKKRSNTIAIILFSFYSLIAPFCITALSYNTVALGCACILVLLYFLEYNSLTIDVVKGFLCANIVLCNPFNIVIYCALVISTLFSKYSDKNGNKSIGKHLLFFHLGICILFIPFLLYLLLCMKESNTDIMGLFNTIGYMLSKDGAHNTNAGVSVFIRDKVVILFTAFFNQYRTFVGLFCVFLFLSVLLRKKHKEGICVICVLCIVFSFYSLQYRNNYPMLFYIFVGLSVFVIEPRLFFSHSKRALIVAYFFVLTTHFASNNILHAIAWACVPGTLLSFLLVEEYMADNVMFKFSKVIVIALSVLFCISVLLLDVNYVFWDDDIENLHCKIEQGPLKGIYTTEANAVRYDAVYTELHNLETNEDDNILLCSTLPVDLLTLQREVCSPSTWCEYEDLDEDYLTNYYFSHPEKVPTVIFVNKLSTKLDEKDIAWLITEKSYSITKENDICIVLKSV